MVAKGTLKYRCDSDPCQGSGWGWSQSELDDALRSDVRSIIYDDEGLQSIEEMFSAGATTDFDMDGVRQLFQCSVAPTDWQVGEGIANAYLRDHRDCFMPWNGQRDLRNPKSSLPGVDICGIRFCNGSDHFFFCEVKTSSENKYPPQVASRRPHSDGLATQVEELCTDVNIRKTILIYLAHRAKNASWENRFMTATRNYLSESGNDASVIGFMVRDVAPNVKDLEKRVKDMAANVPTADNVEFIALYLPRDTISRLSVMIDENCGGVSC